MQAQATPLGAILAFADDRGIRHAHQLVAHLDRDVFQRALHDARGDAVDDRAGLAVAQQHTDIAHRFAWRDLPEEFGNWNSVFQRFRRWAMKGVWESLFNALVEDPDFEYLMIDATIVRTHQHAAGAKGAAKMRPSGVRAAV
jgi:transposase